MSYGYSLRLVEANKRSESQSLGVALGRLCIAKNVPVQEVADQLGVTRMTIYNWFCGTHAPHPSLQSALSAFCDSVTSKN